MARIGTSSKQLCSGKLDQEMTTALLGLCLYAVSNLLHLAVFSLYCWEGRGLGAGLLAAVWLLPGCVAAGAEMWRESMQPNPSTVWRSIVMVFAHPLYLMYVGARALGQGRNSAEWGAALYQRWRAVVGGAPVVIAVRGSLLLAWWGHIKGVGPGVWLQLAAMLVGVTDLTLSGAGWKGVVRESDPLIWYRPKEDTGRKGSFLDRVVEAVTTVLQVEYGATQPGTGTRLPVISKQDQRVVIKRSNLPTFFHQPSTTSIFFLSVPTFIHLIFRVPSLITIALYLHAYIFIPFTVSTVLTAGAALKIVRFALNDSIASALLSLGLPTPCTARATAPAPSKALYSLLNTAIALLVIFITFAVLLGTVPTTGILPILSCTNGTEIDSRPCQEGENPHGGLSILLALLLGAGLLSLLVSWAEHQAVRRRLAVVPRIWSERLKAYQEDLKLMGEGWRVATCAEVAERGRDILVDLKERTVNVHRISKCQGLSIPQCKLQDGVILPKQSFDTIEDIETLSTADEEFKTFDNLFGLRFTRYCVVVRNKY